MKLRPFFELHRLRFPVILGKYCRSPFWSRKTLPLSSVSLPTEKSIFNPLNALICKFTTSWFPCSKLFSSITTLFFSLHSFLKNILCAYIIGLNKRSALVRQFFFSLRKSVWNDATISGQTYWQNKQRRLLNVYEVAAWNRVGKVFRMGMIHLHVITAPDRWWRTYTERK